MTTRHKRVLVRFRAPSILFDESGHALGFPKFTDLRLNEGLLNYAGHKAKLIPSIPSERGKGMLEVLRQGLQVAKERASIVLW